MPGMKKREPSFRFNSNKVTPDEIDQYQVYSVIDPSISATWFGTATGGTAGQSKAVVFSNVVSDYPRNVSLTIVGTNDMGGSVAVTGKDQFGKSITETVGYGTTAAGTPTSQAEGTKIFASISGATVTYAGVGAGSARLGVGTSEGSVIFGLPFKIGSTADLKSMAWINEHTSTTINGGTLGAYADTTYHYFQGTSALAGTQTYTVWCLPTYNAENDDNIAGF